LDLRGVVSPAQASTSVVYANSLQVILPKIKSNNLSRLDLNASSVRQIGNKFILKNRNRLCVDRHIQTGAQQLCKTAIFEILKVINNVNLPLLLRGICFVTDRHKQAFTI